MRHMECMVILLMTLAFGGCKDAPASPGPAPARSGAVCTRPPPDTSSMFFDWQLASVCDEVPEPRAAAYDASKQGMRPMLVFTRKDPGEKWSKAYGAEYQRWQTDVTAQYQLVACVTLKSSKKVRECKFTARKPVRYVDMTDATYEIRIHEAKTGKRLAVKEVDVKAGERCPTTWGFPDRGAQRGVSHPGFGQALNDIALPFVQPQ